MNLGIMVSQQTHLSQGEDIPICLIANILESRLSPRTGAGLTSWSSEFESYHLQRSVFEEAIEFKVCKITHLINTITHIFVDYPHINTNIKKRKTYSISFQNLERHVYLLLCLWQMGLIFSLVCLTSSSVKGQLWFLEIKNLI